MAPWAAPAALLLVHLLSLCLALLAGAAAGPGGCVELQQPREVLAMLVGQTLTLRCTVAGSAQAGAVKWLKASGGCNCTVYDQKNPRPRVVRAASSSNTDFTIHIHDARLDDAGTYYCVKLRADKEDQVSCSGAGTTVSVHESSPFPSVAVAAAAVTLSLLLLIFLVVLCIHWRHRAGGSSPSPQVPDATTTSRSEQGGDPADADIHYADLQHLPAAPRRAPCAAASEYARIPGAAR